MKTDIRIPASKPRNPFVAAARQRLAGAHASRQALRQRQNVRELRQEIERLRPSP